MDSKEKKKKLYMALGGLFVAISVIFGIFLTLSLSYSPSVADPDPDSNFAIRNANEDDGPRTSSSLNDTPGTPGATAVEREEEFWVIEIEDYSLDDLEEVYSFLSVYAQKKTVISKISGLIDKNARISNDGRYICFSAKYQLNSAAFSIKRIDLKSPNKTTEVIVPCIGSLKSIFNFNSTSDEIIYIKNNTFIYRYNFSEGIEYPIHASQEDVIAVAYSSDNSQIFFSNRKEVIKIPASGEVSEVVILNRERLSNHSPDYLELSKDDTKLLMRFHGPTAIKVIYLNDPTYKFELFFSDDTEIINTFFSKDGRFVYCFTHDSDSKEHRFIRINLEEKTEENVTISSYEPLETIKNIQLKNIPLE